MREEELQDVRRIKGVAWTLGIERFFAQEVPYSSKSTREKLLERDRRIQNQTKTIQQTGGIEVLEQNIGHMILLCGLQGCVCLYHCIL